MIIYIKTEGDCRTLSLKGLSLNVGSKGFDIEVYSNIPGAKENAFAGVSFNLKESEEDRQKVRDLISHLQFQLENVNYEESKDGWICDGCGENYSCKESLTIIKTGTVSGVAMCKECYLDNHKEEVVNEMESDKGKSATG